MLKCIMFDFGGTLMNFYDPERAARIYTKIFRKYGFKVNLRKVRCVQRIEQKEHMRETYGDPTRHGKPQHMIKRILNKLNLNVPEDKIQRMADEYRTESEKYYKLYSGAFDIVSELKKRGFKIAIISNGQVKWIERYLKKFKIKRYIDALVVSEEVGYEKSSMVPFKIALKKLRLKPKECLMVGDRLDEDMHAKRLGIWTCHATYGPKLPVVGVKFKPDFRISSIKKLPKILGKIA